jgi:flagellar biosynthesis/type III secretory pathway chaperone
LRSQDLSKVVDILSGEVELLMELHSALKNEQAALVRGDTEGIRDRVEAQIGIIKELAALEEERRAAFRVMCPEEAADRDVKLDTIIGLAGGEQAEHLENMKSSMSKVLKSLGEVNRQNDVLIRQSLSYIDRTLRALAGEKAGSEVYNASGALKAATGQIAVDRRA